KMSGIEVLLEASRVRPLAARIMMTASDRVGDASDAINVARVRRFVSKPFRPTELKSIVSGAVHEALLEAENRRLVSALGEKNRLLERALSEVQANEHRLETEVARRTAELQTLVARLEDQALRDGLTGLYNHRFFQEALTLEVARAARSGRPLSLLFIDVDHFKNYNDLCGHPAGDELLKTLARLLANTGDNPEFRIRG